MSCRAVLVKKLTRSNTGTRRQLILITSSHVLIMSVVKAFLSATFVTVVFVSRNSIQSCDGFSAPHQYTARFGAHPPLVSQVEGTGIGNFKGFERRTYGAAAEDLFYMCAYISQFLFFFLFSGTIDDDIN